MSAPSESVKRNIPASRARPGGEARRLDDHRMAGQGRGFAPAPRLLAAGAGSPHAIAALSAPPGGRPARPAAAGVAASCGQHIDRPARQALDLLRKSTLRARGLTRRRSSPRAMAYDPSPIQSPGLSHCASAPLHGTVSVPASLAFAAYPELRSESHRLRTGDMLGKAERHPAHRKVSHSFPRIDAHHRRTTQQRTATPNP